MRILGAAATLALLASACGSDGDDDDGATAASVTVTESDQPTDSADDAADDSDATADESVPASGEGDEPTGEGGEIDENGVLRIGEFLTAPGGHTKPVFDMTQMQSTGHSSFQYLFYVYDSLLRMNRDLSYSPALAESAEIIDPSTIVVALKPDLIFQDGTPLDAEAVKFTLLRNRDLQDPIMRTQIQKIDTIDVTSPTELTINFAEPVAGAFYPLLANYETAPVSPTAVEAGHDFMADPIGAGPFRVVSQADQLVRFEKWPEYHDADNVHLAAIELVNVASREAMVNALRTHEIDWARLGYSQVNELGGDESITIDQRVEANPTFTWIPMQCNMREDLFGDVRVRQALIYATDREAINNIVYQGNSEIQTQWATSSSPLFSQELAEMYPYDPEKAKSLLAEAGMSDFTMSMVEPAATSEPETRQIVEMVQQQWADAGITLEFVATPSATEDFFINGTIASLVFPAGTAYYWAHQFDLFFGQQFGSTCPPTDPAFFENYAELQALDPDSPEGIAKFQELHEQLLDEARYIPTVLGPTTHAWTDSIGEIVLRPGSNFIYTPDFFGTYMVAD